MVVVDPGAVVVDNGVVVVVVERESFDKRGAEVDDGEVAVADVGANSSAVRRLPEAATRSRFRHNPHDVDGFTPSIYPFY